MYWAWDDNVSIVNCREKEFSEFQNPGSYLGGLNLLQFPILYYSKSGFFAGLADNENRGWQFLGWRSSASLWRKATLYLLKPWVWAEHVGGVECPFVNLHTSYLRDAQRHPVAAAGQRGSCKIDLVLFSFPDCPLLCCFWFGSVFP